MYCRRNIYISHFLHQIIQNYSSLNSLRRHKYLDHQVGLDNEKVEMEVFECDLCDKNFKLQAKLTIHIKNVHEKVLSNICNVCGKGFLKAEALKIHNRVHTGERPLLCKYCKTSRFKESGALNNHYRQGFENSNIVCNLYILLCNFDEKNCQPWQKASIMTSLNFAL